jgi:hypothetical protein
MPRHPPSKIRDVDFSAPWRLRHSQEGPQFSKAPMCKPVHTWGRKCNASCITPAAAPQFRGTIMEHSMKKLVVIVALSTVLAAPAFAQKAPNARQDAQTAQQQWSSKVHVYAPDYYESWHRNQNANPDFQLGYSK